MTDATQLEDGFYWVRSDEEWQIAEKEGKYFYLTKDDDRWYSSAFDEIDPRPIKREE